MSSAVLLSEFTHHLGDDVRHRRRLPGDEITQTRRDLRRHLGRPGDRDRAVGQQRRQVDAELQRRLRRARQRWRVGTRRDVLGRVLGVEAEEAVVHDRGAQHPDLTLLEEAVGPAGDGSLGVVAALVDEDASGDAVEVDGDDLVRQGIGTGVHVAVGRGLHRSVRIGHDDRVATADDVDVAIEHAIVIGSSRARDPCLVDEVGPEGLEGREAGEDLHVRRRDDRPFGLVFEQTLATCGGHEARTRREPVGPLLQSGDELVVGSGRGEQLRCSPEREHRGDR